MVGAVDRYYTFARYIREQGIAGGVRKVTVNAGFTCPNRDGTISSGGCIYCNNEGFGTRAGGALPSVEDQIAAGIESRTRRYGTRQHIVYFQSYTNTYAPLARLKAVYDTVTRFPSVVGISIGTRPDCVNNAILDLIDSYTDRYDVWIEYGLQTIHDGTLALINRGHRGHDFFNAVELTRRCPKIKISAHVILGLPGETVAMMCETASALGRLKIGGVKIHPLHVMRGTRLAELYEQGTVSLLSREGYIDAAVSFLERLWPKTVIQRISADCRPSLLVAPAWMSDARGFREALEQAMKERDSVQGSKWSDERA